MPSLPRTRRVFALLSIALLSSCGAPDGVARDAPPRTPANATPTVTPPSALPAVASANATAVPPAAEALAGPAAPASARALIGSYWGTTGDSSLRLRTYAALALDEDGVMWLFVMHSERICAMVVRVGEGKGRVALEPVYAAQVPDELRASQWSIEGQSLIEKRPDGEMLRDRDLHPSLQLPKSSVHWVGTEESERADAAMLGPLVVARRMYLAGDGCWMGVLLPSAPRYRDPKARTADKINVGWMGGWVSDDHGTARCGMRVLPRDRVVDLGGVMVFGYLFAEDGAPVALYLRGNPGVQMLVPADRRNDPKLRAHLTHESEKAPE